VDASPNPGQAVQAPGRAPGLFHARPYAALRAAVPALVGRSPPIEELRRLIDLVAPTATSVLISGETGTGKEVVARAIHAASERVGRPFVAVNCSALPEHLVESELFGYERGAFTGAGAARPGLFEEAGGGTLFLDEVSDLPLALQPKLLRALQEREVRRLGATRSVRVDVRVVSATNGDLGRAVREGRFRADLYYRLSVVVVHLPALRERKEDLPLLCDYFLQRHAPVTCSPLRRVSAEAMAAMDAYPWPGNVRELENVIERALVMARLDPGDALGPAHLPGELCPADASAAPEPPAAGGGGGVPLDLPAAIRRVRGHYLAEALRLSGGNKVEAARLLGISRRALYDLLAQSAPPAKPSP